ncbi:hypothetical protein MTR67_039044, partial [Solanum verrucosum]
RSVELKESVLKKFVEAFSQGGDGVIRYEGRLCVPDVDGLREQILEEAHSSRCSIHPRATKMYRDLREGYWWNVMKRYIVGFVAKCPNSLYGRRCRSPVGWFEVGEIALIGAELVYEAIEKVRLIRERMKMGQSRQKSYADVRRRDLEFEVNDWVYLKISPMKGVMRFGKKRKLSPRYVGPYQILNRIEKVAYELDFPNELAPMHPILHVYMLKKCIGDPTSIIPLEGLGVDKSLSYDEVLVESAT